MNHAHKCLIWLATAAGECGLAVAAYFVVLRSDGIDDGDILFLSILATAAAVAASLCAWEFWDWMKGKGP